VLENKSFLDVHDSADDIKMDCGLLQNIVPFLCTKTDGREIRGKSG